MILTSLLSIPVLALAQAQPGPITAPGWLTYDVVDTLDSVTNYLFGFLLVIAAIAIIIAAYFFVTAAGDPDKTKRARDFVMYAVIGVLVAFLAKGLVMLVSYVAR
ncbi:hypothetical protein KJA13_03380 [Patescibacteria group bacterium]|nr:hypothetical protein [Patescibacteria group bacterium]